MTARTTSIPDEEEPGGVSPPPRHLTAQGQDRRAEIVAEAERLFAQSGYGRTRMSDIAAAAGVTKGLLYWYFESKQELIAEILLSTRRQLRDQQRTVLEGVDDPLERLYVGTIVSTRFILEHYRLYRISGDDRRELTAVLRESSQVHATDTAATLEEGQRAGVVRSGQPALAMAFANSGVVNNLCAAAHYRSIDATTHDVPRVAAGYVLRACAADPALVDEIESKYASSV